MYPRRMLQSRSHYSFIHGIGQVLLCVGGREGIGRREAVGIGENCRTTVRFNFRLV